jgi:hypothetical protein
MGMSKRYFLSTLNSEKLCCVVRPTSSGCHPELSERDLRQISLFGRNKDFSLPLEMTRQIVTLFPNNDTVLGEKRTHRGDSRGEPKACWKFYFNRNAFQSPRKP